jgi:hypothetical protein
VQLTDSTKKGLTMLPGITRSTWWPKKCGQRLVQSKVAIEQIGLRAGAEVNDEIDIAALRIEGLASGRAEHILALHAKLTAELPDFIAMGFDDVVHGRLAGKFCRW